MSATTQDPSKYFRTSIALSLRHKPEFDARLAAIGLKTVGDLVTLFTQADGTVEALKPIAEKFAQQRAPAPRESTLKVKDVAKKMKGMTPEQLARVLELVEETTATATTPESTQA